MIEADFLAGAGGTGLALCPKGSVLLVDEDQDLFGLVKSTVAKAGGVAFVLAFEEAVVAEADAHKAGPLWTVGAELSVWGPKVRVGTVAPIFDIAEELAGWLHGWRPVGQRTDTHKALVTNRVEVRRIVRVQRPEHRVWAIDLAVKLAGEGKEGLC